MKTRIVIGSLMGTVMAFQVLAQRTENDDMYFNSKDREKLKGEKVTTSASVNDKIDSDYNTFRKKHFDKDEPATGTASENANPTDSYSARSTNPEYISRSNSEQASEDENYYVEGYVPANVYDSYSATNYTNNNNWSNTNSNYGSNYGYGSPYNSYSNPYCGSCNPMMSPYYSAGSGLTFSLGYMWGSPGWNYGMNYGYGMGNSYNPYNYYPSYYSPYYNGYPTTSYYNGPEPSQPNYGKRPSRHSAIVSPTPRSSERVTSNANNTTSGGRIRQSADEYYVKPFKRTSSIDSYINSATNRSSEGYTSPSSPASRTRDSYNSSNTSRDNRSLFSTPSRSSSDVSMPSRSSSSGSSHGGSSAPAPRKRD